MQASTLIQRTLGTHDSPQGKRERNFYIITFGVVLPTIAFLIEVFSHWSREIYFDPFGHPLHLLCVLLVPVANWVGARTHDGRSSRWLFWASNLNSAAILIGAVYSIIYLPILPFGLFAILIAGVGFLPLSPVLALIASLVVRRRLRRLWEDREPRSGWVVHLGLIAAVSALAMPMMPRALTWQAARCALGEPGRAKDWGLSWLRASADVAFLQERAVSSARGFNFSSWMILSPEEAERALFLATGKTLQSAPAWSRDEIREDATRGLQTVGGMIPEVEMSLSSVNSSVDAEAGLAYTEWTFAFTNSALIQHEARMEVELPRDNVVSRLTLWINGEPREAAFGTRAQTTAAYQNVVIQQRRDPVLVTVSGPNRILIQCFPVPPGGAPMQARLGISGPLRLDSHGNGELVFPSILSRNFTLSDRHSSQCWVESRAPMVALDLTKWAGPEAGTYALKGEKPTVQLGEVSIRTASPVGVSYYREPAADGGKIVVQRPASIERWRPEKLAVVLDTSAGLEPARDELIQALSALSKETEFTVLLTKDGKVEPLLPGPPRRLNQQERSRLVDSLEAARFVGGKPNATALIEAWNLVSSSPRGAIVWLHGPEPAIDVPFALMNNLERHPGSPKLFSLQVVPGPNEILNKLSAFPAMERVRWRRGGLTSMFTKWAAREEEKTLVREVVQEVPAGAKETSPHLLRVWAKNEVDRKIDLGQTAAATTLALASKIVTPVTGAVVLENQAQYQAAGLKPENAAKVPTIPEPSETLLAIITFAFLLARRWRGGAALSKGQA